MLPIGLLGFIVLEESYLSLKLEQSQGWDQPQGIGSGHLSSF